MFKSKKHVIAFICNMVIVAVCILSIAAYFFMPFWKISLNAHIDEEAFEEIVDEIDEDADTSKVDLDEVLGEDGLSIDLGITLKTQNILSSIGADPKDNVDALIASNIYNLDAPIETLYSAYKRFIRSYATDYFDDAIMEQLKSVYPEKSESERRAMLEFSDIDRDYIKTQAHNIVTAIETRPTSTDEIVNETFLLVDEVCESLLAHGYNRFAYESEIEKGKVEIQNIVRSSLKPLENEHGILDINKPLLEHAYSLFDREAPSSTTAGRTTDDIIEELKDLLREELVDNVDLETAKLITKIMNVIAYAILFTFFTWIYLIIKILAKLTKPNNTIRLGLPIGLGWLPCLILVVIPNLATSSILGALELDLPFSFSVTFTSGSIVSFGVAIALLLFSICYYGRLRKQLALENCPTVDDPIPSAEPIQNEYDPNNTYPQNDYAPSAYDPNSAYAQNGYAPNAYDPNGAYSQNGYAPNAYTQNGAYVQNGYAPNAYTQNGYAPNAYDPNGAHVQNGYAPTQNFASNEQSEQIEQADHPENKQQ